ncbi:RNA polymerase II transcription factor SIII subunit A [Trichostrongylus colubriformis]|uniref:RNA polymerase II transcription factor SIII subunit A n=1 Tax=Trichostrongylus colubriformis TaxID=6319 RepID=A0AAN8IBZ0_TRICO
MTADDVLLYKVIKYGKLIKKKERISHVLSRLNEVEMTLDILSATNIGRYVNRLCDDPKYGREASRIIEKWKEVARQSGVRGGEEDGSSEGDEPVEDSSPTCRMGLLNGIHDVEARAHDDAVRSQDQRHRSDSRKNDSEMRDRERHRSRHVDSSTHHRSESARDGTNQKRSRSDSQQQDEQWRRRHRHGSGRGGTSMEDSEPVTVAEQRHRRYDDYDRKRKRRCLEEDIPRKRKSSIDPRSTGSDDDGHTDSECKSLGSDKSVALEQSGKGEHEDSSDDQRHYSDSPERSVQDFNTVDGFRTDGEDVEEVGDEKNNSSPSNRYGGLTQTSSRSEKLRKGYSPAEERASTSSKAQSSSTSKSRSRKSAERNKNATAFDAILQSADMPPVKSRKSRDPHWKWAEMPLLNNYQPFPQTLRAVKETPAPPQDDFNPENMFKPRNERGKVFAGRRKFTAVSIPSLFSLCLRVLSNNIRVLYYAEYINYDVLKPILEKCNAETLAHIESKHHYLEEDSSDLWQRIVTKKYPGAEPDDSDSWKDLYSCLEKERERKLKQLSQRIGKHHQADSAKAPRKAILADAAAPSYVRRRQIQNGTGITKPLPSAIEVSSARRKIFETGGCKDALAALPKAVVNKNSTVGAKMDRGGAKKGPAKKGALMIKTMKMLNMKRK